MRKLRVATFVSMDGVMQGPGGPEEDRSGGFELGGWNVTFWDEPLGGYMVEVMGESYDLLLGRRTYEVFAAHWPRVDDETGRYFNEINKYVVGSAGTDTSWVNSHRLDGDAAEAVRALKATEGRDLLIQGSSELIHALLAADLIDELTTLTFPVVLGRGKRLFDEGSKPGAWTLTRSRTNTTGVVVSEYVRAGEVPIGSFALD